MTREMDLWGGDGLLSEIQERGRIAVGKFWTDRTAKGCVELQGFNSDRGYDYSLYASFDDQRKVAGVIDDILGVLVGDPKWVGLHLLEKSDVTPLDEPWAEYEPRKLRKDIEGNDKKANESGLELARERLGNRAVGKNIYVEYEIKVDYLIQRNNRELKLQVLALNDSIDETLKNASEDAQKLGKIIGYHVPEVKGVELVDVADVDESTLVAKVKTNTD
jgi:hypothetical protein